LGVVVVETTGQSSRVAVFGRIPHPKRLPKEFQGLGEITLGILSGWCGSMLQEASIVDAANVFDDLASRWRWNVFLTKPKKLQKNEIHGELSRIAERTYEKFVRLPFKENEPKSDEQQLPEIPAVPAWRLRTFTESDIGQFVEQ